MSRRLDVLVTVFTACFLLGSSWKRLAKFCTVALGFTQIVDPVSDNKANEKRRVLRPANENRILILTIHIVFMFPGNKYARGKIFLGTC